MIINSRTMGRAITDRVRRLRDGASVIGGGDLDHRIDIKGDDEFAELSEAFNAMTAKLKTSYHDLEHEVEERRQAEEETQRLLKAVQEEKDRLSALINSISDEVWFADSERKFTLANPSALREFRHRAASEIDVEKLAASLEVYRPDGSPRPIEEAPPLRALRGDVVTNQEEIIRYSRQRGVEVSPGQFCACPGRSRQYHRVGISRA